MNSLESIDYLLSTFIKEHNDQSRPLNHVAVHQQSSELQTAMELISSRHIDSIMVQRPDSNDIRSVAMSTYERKSNNTPNRPSTRPENSMSVYDDSDSDSIEETDTKSDDNSGTNSKLHGYSLRKYASRPISCNGDCDSQFAKLINNIINPNSKKKLDIAEEKIIAREFWLHGEDTPLRTLLRKQIENQPFLEKDDKLVQMKDKLKNPDNFIGGKKWTEEIINFFKLLHDRGYDHILYNLANATCKFPDKTMFGEHLAYEEARIKTLQDKIDEMNRFEELLLNHQVEDSKKDSNILRDLQDKNNAKKKKLLQQLDEMKKALNASEDKLNDFKDKIQKVKNHPKYAHMKKRNMELTDTEIYAVIKYTHEDWLCSKMRASQRDNNKYNISCQWKKFFYHLCCAVYKINTIFHHKNKTFKKHYITNRYPWKNKLYRGIHKVYSINNKHPLHTISSFSGDPIVAETFSNKDGMIIAIPNAFQAIYDGKLMAADVSWISKFPGEEEFLLAPISFEEIAEKKQGDKGYDSMPIAWDTIKVWEVTKYKSDKMESVRHNSSQRISNPMALFESTLPERNSGTKRVSRFILALIVVGFVAWYTCPNESCQQTYRMCEATTSFLSGYIECPCCRTLFSQWPQLIDENRRIRDDELECYNLECDNGKPRIIKHTDLMRVKENKHLGFECRFCKMQQRKALSDRYSDKYGDYVNKVADKLIHHIEEASTPLFRDWEEPMLDLKPDRQEFVETLKFVMNIERAENIDTNRVMWKHPIILKWGLKFAGFSDMTDSIMSFLNLWKPKDETESKVNEEERFKYPVNGGIYRIYPIGGMQRYTSILSANGHELVEILSQNDASGRQQWVFQQHGSYWNIIVSGGIYGDKRYLSTDGGNKICLACDDDESGRQRWKINRASNGGYNIEICAPFVSDDDGFEQNFHLLSTDGDNLVNMYIEDDGSGRQKWRFKRVECIVDGIYRISPKGAMKYDGMVLSTDADGNGTVYMNTHDDGTGRQRWLFKNCGSYWNIVISSCVSGDVSYLSMNGKKKVCLSGNDDGSGRQRWNIRDSGKGWYRIEICSPFVFDDGEYNFYSLGTDGHELVDIFIQDIGSGSGRQKWTLEKVEGVDDTNDALCKEDELEQQIDDVD